MKGHTGGSNAGVGDGVGQGFRVLVVGAVEGPGGVGGDRVLSFLRAHQGHIVEHNHVRHALVYFLQPLATSNTLTRSAAEKWKALCFREGFIMLVVFESFKNRTCAWVKNYRPKEPLLSVFTN
jgi:hypothetical protein